jgi:hypothetical protein
MNKYKTLMTKAVAEQKRVVDRPILLWLLKKESPFQVGEKRV